MNQSRNGTSRMLLPAGFVTVHDILDNQVQPRSRVSIVGVVTDFRVPVPTRGADWKCQIRFYDHSTEDDSESILLNIFRPEDDMPVASLGDVILLTSVTVQVYQMDGLSLLTNRETKIHIYEAGKIPRPPKDASCALRPPTKRQTARPGDKENAYVSYMFRTVDKSRLPGKEEFELLKIQSANVKDKFSELKDVQEGKFCDIIAQVVKEPYDLGDKMTVWVSDFTENSAFFHYSLGGKDLSEGRDGDPFGYTNKFIPDTSLDSEWQGPFGKKSIQLTLYEPHASYVRECPITMTSWVSIKNLHIKYGHNAANLEGILREDRGAQGVRVRIANLDPSLDRENMNPRLKAALYRKRDYEKSKKRQLKDIRDAAKAGEKRKAAITSELEPKENSKSRRKKNRAQKGAPKEASKTDAPSPVVAVNVNPSVRCENESIKTHTITEILEPVLKAVAIDGEIIKLPLPFTCSNYRAQVHVVDFRPSNLMDFAIPRKASSEFDVLSDNEATSDSESESDSDADNTQGSAAALGWQWRFSLQLEDAATTPGQEKKRVWVAVDNPAAQCLMGLDASDLRRRPTDLVALRQKLWILWGELEEHKSVREMNRAKTVQAAQRGEAPLHSSDNEEESSMTPRKDKEVHNTPFTCCIRQYGVMVREPDPTKVNAKNGKRWQRMFALFGTKITGS